MRATWRSHSGPSGKTRRLPPLPRGERSKRQQPSQTVHAALLQTLTQFGPRRGDAQSDAVVRLWIGNALATNAAALDPVPTLAEIEVRCQRVHRKAKPSAGGKTSQLEQQTSSKRPD